MHLVLSDGRIVQRVFAGYIRSEADLEKFVAEARHELAKGRPILAELWEQESLTIRKRAKVPTEAEEMSATN
jgi:hypothetical protein